MKTRNCAYEHCGKMFAAREKKNIYCSRQCKENQLRLDRYRKHVEEIRNMMVEKGGTHGDELQAGGSRGIAAGAGLSAHGAANRNRDGG